jgi:hypothetical protein
LLLTMGGILWKQATRQANAEAAAATALQRADTASLAVAANADKVEKVASELAKHREDVAKDYVSYKHMQALEKRLIDAISQCTSQLVSLGNRIDGLFSRIPPQHG